MKICVYAISKNEIGFVQRFCDSAKEADLILIADTGSTDGFQDEARRCGAVVHEISISPWRFDLARNAALALVPSDYDVCISLDIDEVLTPGWREEIERVWSDGTTRLRYLYDWSNDTVFYSEKIHARRGYMWHHPCHERVIPDGRCAESWAQTDRLLIVHKPDPMKSRGQYLDLLELSVKEDPHCSRNAFYYARELSFYGKWSECIAACDKYLKMPDSTWSYERSYAYRVIGKCYVELNDLNSAEKAFHLAASEASDTREPWCELSSLMYKQSRWAESFAYACRAVQIVHRPMVYTVDPKAWAEVPHDYMAIAAWNLGLKDIALEQGKIAVDINPNDKRLQDNVKWFSGETPSQDAA